MFGIFKKQVAYTVHEQPSPPADRDERAERLEFVREGFSFFAFVLPPLWMLAKKLWLVLIGYLLVLVAIHSVITLFELPEGIRYYATMALNLLVGFEADTLQRWSLDRRNWRMIGTVSGANSDECERRFFHTWVPSVAIVTPANFDKPGTFEAAGRAQAPLKGTVMPPKRTSWQSSSGWPSWKRS